MGDQLVDTFWGDYYLSTTIHITIQDMCATAMQCCVEGLGASHAKTNQARQILGTRTDQALPQSRSDQFNLACTAIQLL